MSNRTLIEINHDYWSKILKADLRMDLRELMTQGANLTDPETLERLDRLGIHVFGTRHHTDPIDAPLRDRYGNLKLW